MLKLNDIKFGLASYGAGNGTAVFLVDIGETEDEKEQLKYEDFKQAMRGKIEGFHDYTKQYDEFLSASQKFHIYFQGGSIEKSEYADDWSKFLGDLSKDSSEYQKGVRADKLRPPFIVWIGEPTKMSGMREGLATFYEYFNFVVGFVTPNTPDLPLHELCNHNFHCCVIKVKSMDDVDFLNGKQLRPNEITLLDMNESPSEDIQLLCMKNGFRYFHYTDKGYFILP